MERWDLASNCLNICTLHSTEGRVGLYQQGQHMGRFVSTGSTYGYVCINRVNIWVGLYQQGQHMSITQEKSFGV